MLVLQLCDRHAEVTCVDLDLYNQNGKETSVCMQCPDGYTGNGRQCRSKRFSLRLLANEHYSSNIVSPIMMYTH